ncbi:glycosyltransferase [Leifsonia sp. F6_8S_P_1B]|uniref:Glycosyltransferase n=1 Tax=Leifsonia williamsii TaxID=3035919 RepID=A0ABT8K628_9MICO|nr:glycosyltransferase [Leifsonia williamsii]MDN4612891.1 glycosyltransferase [Leifsonia williamsii]
MTETVVYIPGSRWNDVAGTDRRMAEALSERVDVLWVDPPRSVLTKGADRSPAASASGDAVAPGIRRVRTTAPPGFTRPLIADVANALVGASVRRAVADLGVGCAGTVLASPLQRFPRGVPGRKVLYLTDDWLAGADLMGFSRDRVERSLRRNAAEADIIAAVTADVERPPSGAREVVLPNGCLIPPVAEQAPEAVACLVGQLNERLDLRVLEAVRDRGVPILAIGPLTARDPGTRERLRAFLDAPTVTWLGEIPPEEIPGRLATVSVGMTPYADSAFNRASFPLKTLEYLASGLHTVSTDLPSARGLQTPLVQIAGDPDAFADAVVAAVAAPGTASDRESRRTFAQRHSWRARADQLLTELGLEPGPQGG